MLTIIHHPSEIRTPPVVVFLLLLGLLLSGCGRSGPTLGKVSGKVTLHGRPVAAGTVMFLPESGPMASGALDAEGRYCLTTKSSGDGALVGKHQVTVIPPSEGLVLEPGKPPRTPVSVGSPSNIPAKFQNVKTSTLTAEVRPGSNAFDYDLAP